MHVSARQVPAHAAAPPAHHAVHLSAVDLWEFSGMLIFTCSPRDEQKSLDSFKYQ